MCTPVKGRSKSPVTFQITPPCLQDSMDFLKMADHQRLIQPPQLKILEMFGREVHPLAV